MKYVLFYTSLHVTTHDAVGTKWNGLYTCDYRSLEFMGCHICRQIASNQGVVRRSSAAKSTSSYMLPRDLSLVCMRNVGQNRSRAAEPQNLREITISSPLRVMVLSECQEEMEDNVGVT